MNKRICPPHLRGKPVGHSYHDHVDHPLTDQPCRVETPDERIQRRLVTNVGEARPFFRRIETIGREPNDILKDLTFMPHRGELRYGGAVTGCIDHTKPNESAKPQRSNVEIRFVPETEFADMPQSQPPKSSQPPRDVFALCKALSAGRDKVDAELIAEIVCMGGAVDWYLDRPFDELMKIREEFKAQRAKADALLMQTMLPTDDKTLESCRDRYNNTMNFRGFPDPNPPGQPLPKIKISVYLDDGNVFEYEVDTVTSAREHVSLIVKTGYRHSDKTRPDELVHFPPHRISKVKMRGPGITTNYYDSPRGT